MLQGALEHLCSNLDKPSAEAADKSCSEFYPSIAHLRDMQHHLRGVGENLINFSV